MGARSERLRVLAISACLGTIGCSLLPGAESPSPTRPAAMDEQARCKVAASQENPLVTEWDAAQKANLEARIREGGVAVSYSGCTMRLLPQCGVAGRYAWRRTTTMNDMTEMRSTDELYAKLPLGAASLEAELERSGRLAVQTTVSGQLELTGHDVNRIARNPACKGATHVVGSLSVGAYRLRRGDALAGRGGASVAGVGASAGHGRDRSVMRASGNPEMCSLGTEEMPHPECRSPVQVFLWPLPGAQHGPPGALRVRFLPPDSDQKWDVVVGERKVCTAPCDRWVDPVMPFAFRTEGRFLQGDWVEDIPDLREHTGQGELEVHTRPRDGGQTALGIVLTSLGGVAMITGTTLLAVGCDGSSTGQCVAGAVTLPVGALGVTAGILMIVNARSRIEVAPVSTPRAPPAWE